MRTRRSELTTPGNSRNMMEKAAAWLIDEGEDPAKQASMAKYNGTEKLFDAADNAVQVFGGNGLTHDYPIQRIFRYAA